MQQTPQSIRPVVLAGIALAFIWPVLMVLASPTRLLADWDVGSRLLVGELMQWSLAILLVALVVFGERRPLSSLGLRRPTLSTVGWGLLTGLILLLALGAAQAAMKAAGVEVKSQGVDFGALPVWAVVALALRAGIVEEIVFRGFLIERIQWLSGKAWIGALVSFVFFVVIHLKSWSVGHLLFVAVAGGILTVLYVRRRDLGANIIAHVSTDVVGLVALHFATRAA